MMDQLLNTKIGQGGLNINANQQPKYIQLKSFARK